MPQEPFKGTGEARFNCSRRLTSLQAASHPPPGPHATPCYGLPPPPLPGADRRRRWRRRGGVQEVQGHAVAPDGGPAFDDDKSAAGDVGQRRERLGGGDGRGDGDGVDDWGDQFSDLRLFLPEEQTHPPGR